MRKFKMRAAGLALLFVVATLVAGAASCLPTASAEGSATVAGPSVEVLTDLHESDAQCVGFDPSKVVEPKWADDHQATFSLRLPEPLCENVDLSVGVYTPTELGFFRQKKVLAKEFTVPARSVGTVVVVVERGCEPAQVDLLRGEPLEEISWFGGDPSPYLWREVPDWDMGRVQYNASHIWWDARNCAPTTTTTSTTTPTTTTTSTTTTTVPDTTTTTSTTTTVPDTTTTTTTEPETTTSTSTSTTTTTTVPPSTTTTSTWRVPPSNPPGDTPGLAHTGSATATMAAVALLAIIAGAFLLLWRWWRGVRA